MANPRAYGRERETPKKLEGQWPADSQTEAFDEGFGLRMAQVDQEDAA
jgi:soluble cytochrome b562